MKPSVFIVEDEPFIAESLTFLLERAGLEVTVAYEGVRGLQTLQTSPPPALVILDVMVPKLNGFDILTSLRKNQAFDATKIAVLTAKGQASDREKALHLGADVFITKPFSNRDLVETLLRLIEHPVSPAKAPAS